MKTTQELSASTGEVRNSWEEIGRREKKQEQKKRKEGLPRAQHELQQGFLNVPSDERDVQPKGRY